MTYKQIAKEYIKETPARDKYIHPAIWEAGVEDFASFLDKQRGSKEIQWCVFCDHAKEMHMYKKVGDEDCVEIGCGCERFLS